MKMKVIVIGLLVLLGFRCSSVGKDTNGGASGVNAGLLGVSFFSDTNNGERGLVKIAQHLTDQGKTNLATALRKFHSHYGQSMANASYLIGSNAEQITYLKQMGQLYRYCDELLPQISGFGAISGEITGFALTINNSGLFVKGVNNTGEEVFYMMTKSGNQLIKTEAIGNSNGALKVKTAFEDIPEGEVSSLQLIKHSPNDAKHITTTGELTDEAIIAGMKKDGSAFICEGKKVNGKWINNCFAKGTLVSTSAGLVAIESIKKGDAVPSYNEKNNSIEIATVTALSQRTVHKLYRIITTHNDTILTTPEHPFWISEGKWVQAQNLNTATMLIDYKHNKLAIVSKQAIDTTATVYNFEVAGTHTYLVSPSQLIVHNNCGETYAKGLNKVLGRPDASSLKQKLYDIDQFLLNGNNAAANEVLGLAFSATHPIRLAAMLNNQNFVNNYFKGAANTNAAGSSWLKDYNFLKSSLAQADNPAELVAYFLEARAYTPPAGTLADYNVSNYPDWLLKELHFHSRNGVQPLPAYRSAANLAPFMVTKTVSGSFVRLADYNIRTNLSGLSAAELEALKKNLSMADIKKYYANRISGKLVKTTDGKIEYTNPAGKLLKWSEQSANHITNAINTSKNLPVEVNNIGRITEAKVGEFVKGKKNLESYGIKIYDDGGQVAGELDVSTLDEIIEVKASFSSVDEDQFGRLLNSNENRFLNPYQKKVILYIDKPITDATQGQVNMINRIKGKGVIVVNSLNELGGILK